MVGFGYIVAIYYNCDNNTNTYENYSHWNRKLVSKIIIAADNVSIVTKVNL